MNEAQQTLIDTIKATHKVIAVATLFSTHVVITLQEQGAIFHVTPIAENITVMGEWDYFFQV